MRPDKAVYEGEFEYGEINGQGKFKFRDGSWYEGSFQHGIFDGEGTYRFPNGDIYRGTWIRGEVTCVLDSEERQGNVRLC